MRGRVRLELKTRDGAVVARREAQNAVLRSGAELLARLFAGQGGPITHLAVGSDDTPESETYSTAALTTGGDEPLEGDTEVPLTSEAFAFEVDAIRHVVHVRVRGTLPAAAAVGNLREAGLLARGDGGDRLYNRVTFPSLEKGDDHELTLF